MSLHLLTLNYHTKKIMYFPHSVRYKLWLKLIIICSKLQLSSHDNKWIELPMTFLFLGLLRRPALLYMPDFYEGERALCSYPMVSERQKLVCVINW